MQTRQARWAAENATRSRDSGEWMSTNEAARFLGVALRTVYRFANDGVLPAYKIGRVIRFRRFELEEFIESCRVQPGDLDNLVPHLRAVDAAEDDDEA